MPKIDLLTVEEYSTASQIRKFQAKSMRVISQIVCKWHAYVKTVAASSGCIGQNV